MLVVLTRGAMAARNGIIERSSAVLLSTSAPRL